MSTTIAIDGALCEGSASISVLDRGFLYGDSIYEVFRAYGGRPWALDEHLDRLERSARLLEIILPVSRAVLAHEIADTLAAAGHDEAYVRLIITRGSGPIGLDPGLATRPCRVIIVTALHPLSPELYAEGVKAHLVSARGRSATLMAGGAKSGNYLPNIMALAAARKQGAHEALLLDETGRVAEGSSSNVFAVTGGGLRTPPERAVLPGITRAMVLDLARRLGLTVAEEPLLPEALQGADEVFLTSTLREVLPVTRIDEHVIGDGRPGPVTRKLQEAYRRHVADGLH